MPGSIFIGRWTPKILFHFRRGLTGTGNCAATSETTLRNLESTGLIARRVTSSKPIAVEYSLSKLRRTIISEPLPRHDR